MRSAAARPDPLIEAWCSRQLLPWEMRGLDPSAVADELAGLNETEPTLFLFMFEGSSVRVAGKPAALEVDGWLQARADLYRRFFEDAMRAGGWAAEGVLGMGLADAPLTSERTPLFAFQKPAGHPAILLNDIDFLWHEFFEARAYLDPVAYRAKAARAVFVGSTSGAEHDAASVRALSNPRVRALAAFRDEPRVDFRLPRIVQCADEEAASLLAGLGAGEGEASWREQFDSRLILSMDGNGATCSRVAVALKSRSALVKYDSPHELHYFGGLVPWLHYLPVGSEADVLALVDLERAEPGRFEPVAEAGRRFHRRYLTRRGGLAYASALLHGYFGRVLRRGLAE